MSKLSKKLGALGTYLKEQHTNGKQIYSALFLTAATVATGGVFGWAALGAATTAQAVGMAAGGVVGVSLGVYAGAPMVKDFVSGAVNAVKNAGSDNTSGTGRSGAKAAISAPSRSQDGPSAWDKIKSLTSAFSRAGTPKSTAQHSMTGTQPRHRPGLG